MRIFKVGQKVSWNWMGRKVDGSIKKVFFKPVTRDFRGTTFKRNGSRERPAYWVKSLAGSDVLKAHTELKKV